MSRYRIAIAGFQHETNTFAAKTASMADFQMADSWPEMLTGIDVIAGTRGINLPIAGFIAEAEDRTSIELVPVLWCAAEPSAHVEDDAFETICNKIIDGIGHAGKIDGIYLDLHGAMVTQSHDDGEGELLRRLRSRFGDEIPVAVSLDLHANVTPQMVRHATYMEAFRTYPHLDMAKTGGRCVEGLIASIKGAKSCSAFRQVPYLVPLHAQYTGNNPCRGLYQLLENVCSKNGISASILLGFTAADIADAGPSVLVYAQTQSLADAAAESLLEAFENAEYEFETMLLSPVEAVQTAIATASDKPVVIADIQDNPGAGASSDTTGLLKALAQERVDSAVLALLCDAYIADKAHKAGEGSFVEAALGGRSGVKGDDPFHGRFKVLALSDGRCEYTGEMYGGGTALLGNCAVLEVCDVPGKIHMVVSSRRSQCLDQAIFTHIGLDLAQYQIICVKSTVHYRADFESIASAIIETAAPGLFICELDQIPYRNLREGIRVGPRGKPFVKPEQI